MINTTLLKEESDQVIYLKYGNEWKRGKFMWFHNGNIEIMLDGHMNIFPIHKKNWNLLSLTRISIDDLCIN